jgi:hypothetical protein
MSATFAPMVVWGLGIMIALMSSKSSRYWDKSLTAIGPLPPTCRKCLARGDAVETDWTGRLVARGR